MNQFVLDAFVAVEWVASASADPYALAVQARVQAGWGAVVPLLWPWEVANAVLMLERRRVLTSVEANQGLSELERFFSSKAQVKETPVTMSRLVELARSYQLTVYDTTYLELAQREDLPLATLDGSLRAAALNVGVSLLK